MNILFLCTANIHRSRTAEDIFRPQFLHHNFLSAGLSQQECLRNGSTLCTEALLKWADTIYVFETKHVTRIREHTCERYTDKIHCLQIDDIYQYMQPELIHLLNKQIWCFNSQK